MLLSEGGGECSSQLAQKPTRRRGQRGEAALGLAGYRIKDSIPEQSETDQLQAETGEEVPVDWGLTAHWRELPMFKALCWR